MPVSPLYRDRMHPPDLACWNPVKRRFRGRIGRRLPFWAPVNNFGDLLGPLVANGILARNGRAPRPAVSFEEVGPWGKLLSVGSILHYAHDGDTVWGSGRNGKIADDRHRFSRLDVRMLRGPRTRAFLQTRGIDAPELYGDPALLVPTIFADRIADWPGGRHALTLVSNLNDPPLRWRGAHAVDPCGPLWSVLQTIHDSETIVSSSLHGFIMAEVFGRRARLIASAVETAFKYEDYFQGTGRTDVPIHTSVEAALAAPDHPPPVFDASAMIAAFPLDLFPQKTA